MHKRRTKFSNEHDSNIDSKITIIITIVTIIYYIIIITIIIRAIYLTHETDPNNWCKIIAKIKLKRTLE